MTDQLDIFDYRPPQALRQSSYPEVPGAAPISETSKAAAVKVKSKAKRIRREVLDLLRRHGGHTVREAGSVLGYEQYEIQPRFSELHRDGKIVDSGEERISAKTDSPATVWVLNAN